MWPKYQDACYFSDSSTFRPLSACNFLQAGCSVTVGGDLESSTFFLILLPLASHSHSGHSHICFSLFFLLWIFLGLCLAWKSVAGLIHIDSLFHDQNWYHLVPLLETEGLKEDVMSVYIGVVGLGIFGKLLLNMTFSKRYPSCFHLTIKSTSNNNLRLSGLLHEDQVMTIIYVIIWEIMQHVWW